MGKKNHITTVLFVLTMLLLSVSALQRHFRFFSFKPLGGVYVTTQKPELSFASFLNSDYQSKTEPYLKENLGFREPLVRLYNQFLYDFFNKTYSKEVLIGKDHWCYYVQHVNEYNGTEMYRWYPSNEEACADFDREARLMWKLRGVLKDYGIEFLMFMAPDKGFLYPEHLPDLERDTTTVNAREYYSRKFDENGFPYIEMTKWFLQIKEADTLPYSLMPQCGAHWGFSAVLAADSLFRFMGNLNGQRFPEMKIGPLHESSEHVKAGDRDLEGILNLMRPFPHEYDKLYDAEVTIVKDSATIWPSVLFVGNSFLWRMHDFIPFDDMFSHSEYWFYNSTAYFGKNYSQMGKVLNLDLLSKLMESDYVVWFTDGNQMYKLSYCFAEMALLKLCFSDEFVNARRAALMDSLNVTYAKADELILHDPEHYFPELAGDSIPTARNPRIPEVLAAKEIKSDPQWILALRSIPSQRHLSLNDLINIEARNVVNHWPLLRDTAETITREEYIESLIRDMMDEMRNKPELMQMIKEKAKAKGRTIENQLEADSRWLINERIQKGEILLEGFE